MHFRRKRSDLEMKRVSILQLYPNNEYLALTKRDWKRLFHFFIFDVFPNRLLRRFSSFRNFIDAHLPLLLVVIGLGIVVVKPTEMSLKPLFDFFRHITKQIRRGEPKNNF